MLTEHEACVSDLQAQLAHETKEKETVAQQLVSKIRQLRIERERAELAESKIPPMRQELKAAQDAMHAAFERERGAQARYEDSYRDQLAAENERLRAENGPLRAENERLAAEAASLRHLLSYVRDQAEVH